MSDETPRPQLDVTNLETPKPLWRERRRAWKKLFPKGGKKMSRILYKFREMQRDMLRSDDIEDPNPYAKTYVFYALSEH
jgi:hypothetical protein